ELGEASPIVLDGIRVALEPKQAVRAIEPKERRVAGCKCLIVDRDRLTVTVELTEHVAELDHVLVDRIELHRPTQQRLCGNELLALAFQLPVFLLGLSKQNWPALLGLLSIRTEISKLSSKGIKRHAAHVRLRSDREFANGRPQARSLRRLPLWFRHVS